MSRTKLVQTLMEHDLVDELRLTLTIDPIIVGGGKRFFRDDGAAVAEVTPLEA